ncbi:YidB family protein [Devosia sp.]|uniref:YidB family protein n=1 Tax=Devosia sp. TaxID=1871048 RepID=UPI0032674452
MSRGMPSMVALLGLLAVAGYQNRDKLGGILGASGKSPAGAGVPQYSGLDGMLGGLGGVLSGGLGGLLDHFNQAGNGAKAQSWVSDGANEPIDSSELERTLGPETIDALTRQTGLSRTELLERLSKTLPEAVNTLTPAGRLPTEAEAGQLVAPQA